MIALLRRLDLPGDPLDDETLHRTLRLRPQFTGDPATGPAAVRLPLAGTLHPIRLLAGLAERVLALEGSIFENARVSSIGHGSPVRLEMANGEVLAREVVVATAGYTPDLGLFRGRILPVHLRAVVTDPLGAMQSAISNPIESVKEGVTSTVSKLFHEFDPTKLVREHPVASMGVAVLGGFAASFLLFRSGSTTHQARAFSTTPGGASPPGEPNLFQSLFGLLGTEVMKVGRQVVEEASKSIVDKAKSAMGNFGVGTHSSEADPAVRM